MTADLSLQSLVLPGSAMVISLLTAADPNSYSRLPRTSSQNPASVSELVWVSPSSGLEPGTGRLQCPHTARQQGPFTASGPHSCKSLKQTPKPHEKLGNCSCVRSMGARSPGGIGRFHLTLFLVFFSGQHAGFTSRAFKLFVDLYIYNLRDFIT